MENRNMKRRGGWSIRLGRVAAIGVLAVLAQGAAAATVIWTGFENNDWFNPNNWSAFEAPAGGDDVIIDSTAAPNTNVLLSAETPWLGSLSISNAILTFTNWTTALNATNVCVGTNGILTLPPAFTNQAMSNRVYVVCSNFMLEAAGRIVADGKGYAEKNGPGAGASSYSGAGGGYGGKGGRSRHFFSGGGPYGSHSEPDAPGSGGGKAAEYAGGGHGGGAVRIAASGNVTIHGTISANGANPLHYYSGGGSGGGVHIMCAGAFGGNGRIRADGGSCVTSGTASGGSGGGGRIAVLYGSLAGERGVRFSTTPPFPNQKSATPNSHWPEMAQKGTLCLQDAALLSETLDGELFKDVRLFIPGFTTWTVNSLLVSNCSLEFAESDFRLVVSNEMRIDSGGKLGLGSYSVETGNPRLDCGNLVVTHGGELHVYSGMTNGVSPDYGALVSVTNDIRVSSNSWIYPYSHNTNGGSVLFRLSHLSIAATNGGFNANARGYSMATGPGKGVSDPNSGSGAGHGGQGGRSRHVATGGAPYGRLLAPTVPGSGGGITGQYAFEGGGYGGGVVRVMAAGLVTVDGTITANAADAGHAYNGGGSGGAIHITCAGVSGGTNGLLRANGGNLVVTAWGGAGGGGRIAVAINVPEAVAAQLLAGQHSDDVIAASTWRDYLGALSVTNGAGGSYTNVPDAYPGTAVFITYTVRGTLILIR